VGYREPEADRGREYRGYKARKPGLARVRKVGRAEIMAAIDRQAPGSRRLRGRHAGFQYQLGLSLMPQLAEIRADGRESAEAFAAELARTVRYEDGTTFHSRTARSRAAGRCESTWKAVRRLLETAMALVTVRKGCKYWDEDGSTRNDAAVYVLVLPRAILRKIAAARRAAKPRPLTRPPTGEGSVVTTTPRLHGDRAGEGRRGPPSGRAAAQGRPPAGAQARPGGHSAGQGGADRTLRALARPFDLAGYGADDMTWAVYHHPDGREHWHRDPIRHPVAWLRYRLTLHFVPEDARAFRAGRLRWSQVRVIPPRSQVLAAAAARDRADLEQLRAGRAAAAAAWTDPRPYVDQILQDAGLSRPGLSERKRSR
jgi:hypothetical protein